MKKLMLQAAKILRIASPEPAKYPYPWPDWVGPHPERD